jgi:pimeloyl-ACP methyl ester carboxylesterase
MSSNRPAAASQGERLTLVFIHGFLDGGTVWDPLISALGDPTRDALRVDLPGMGARTGEDGPYSLDRFADDVAGQIEALARPVIVVGQSMGAQVAELVAGRLADQVRGLVLLTPVPLQGSRLPPEAMKLFSGLGGNAPAQRDLRRTLSIHLDGVRLERLARLGDAVRPANVGEFANLWNRGHALGAERTLFKGPVLVVRGEGDPFVTAEMVRTGVLPRFDNPGVASIGRAGHWPHVEQPDAVAGVLRDFVATVQSAGGAQKGWTRAFEQKTSSAFGDAFAPDIVLEASVMARPAMGAAQVQTVMAAASKIYEALAFTHEAVNGSRHYLEWEAQAFGGEKLSGVTILTKNEEGKIVRAAIHHRPLGAALKFSAELRRRLQGQIDPSHFHGAE